MFSELDYDCPPWPQLSPDAKDFVQQLLVKDPAQRASAIEALDHRYCLLLYTFASYGHGSCRQHRFSHRCAVLCIAVPCCARPCRAVPCCAVLCCAMLRYAVLVLVQKPSYATCGAHATAVCTIRHNSVLFPVQVKHTCGRWLLPEGTASAQPFDTTIVQRLQNFGTFSRTKKVEPPLLHPLEAT